MTQDPGQLGKYRILAEIGKGGFATVYRALDTSLDREVALKVLDPILARDPAWVARFQREAKAVARLRHPHIVTIHEIGESEGRLYIAMELIGGPSLAERIAEHGRLPWDEALAILGQVAAALDDAHGQGVLHRDLKPANILLDPARGAILTDFGFARLVGESSMMSVSLSGGVVGTPAYIAPEVWDGEEPTSQTDLYSLGCVAYEMLTGEVLFAGKTPSVVMRQHLMDGPQLPKKWPEGVPAGMSPLLHRALAQRAADRPASMQEFIETLAAAHTKPAPAEPRQIPPQQAVIQPRPIAVHALPVPEQTHHQAEITARQTSGRIWIVTGLFFLAGLVIGWQIIAWRAFPVQYENAIPNDLRAAERDEYLILVAESYAGNRDLRLAQERLATWPKSELASAMADLQGRLAVVDIMQAAYVSRLADVLGLSQSPDRSMGSMPTTALAVPTTPRTVADTTLTATSEPIRIVATSVQPTTPSQPKPKATPTPSPTARVTYVIQAGDTFASIAMRLGVTMEALMMANNITDPDRLSVGQVLVVPTSISRNDTPTPGRGIPATYVIQSGDTLLKIAGRFGVTVEALMKANNITNPDRPYVGQVLVIP